MSCNTPAAVHHSHQRPQLLFLDRYALHKTIGEGTYGKVKLATNTHTSQQVALKIIEKKSLRRTVDVQRLKNEVRIMHLVRHPNIVHLFEVLESDTQIVFESEYAAGGELYNLIVQTGPLTHAFAHSVFVQLVAAVEYLHAHFIVHRDIKPENIMVSRRGEAKIVDFGFARFYNRSADCSTSCGSLKYCAPEVIRHEKYQGPEVDVWSLGVTLYTMINASLPFMSETNNEAEIVRRICSSHPRAGLHFDRGMHASWHLPLVWCRHQRGGHELTLTHKHTQIRSTLC
ncbi:kinase-like domain-containing protein [Entophlyctis helioformis]|nr:kinase-like domain-containing protein [Entophlyctis helioformis]